MAMEKWRRKKLNVAVYEPKKKFEVKKEAMPFFINLFLFIGRLGQVFALFVSTIFSGVKGFFSAKERVRDYQRGHEKVLDLRKSRRLR